jgi:hypothetical protein
MRVAAAAILGAVVAAALSAAAFQWFWSIYGTAGAGGFLAETATVLVALAGVIIGGLGAAWATMPRRAFFIALGVFILTAAAQWRFYPSGSVSWGFLKIIFPLGSLVVGRVLGWLVGVRGRNRSTATTAD